MHDQALHRHILSAKDRQSLITLDKETEVPPHQSSNWPDNQGLLVMPYKKLGLACTSDCPISLVSALQQLGFDVRALWCPSTDLSIQIAAENDIPFVANNPDQVILRKDVEMLVVVGNPSFHARLCIRALGIGKHVLCSVPVALTLQDAQELMQVSDYYPQLLSLAGYGLRQLEVFRRFRRLLQKGTFLGTPSVVQVTVRSPSLFSSDEYDWRWEHSSGGGVLNLVGCHVIDLLQFLLGRRVRRVHGLVETRSTPNGTAGQFRRLRADDFCSFLLQLQGGMSVTCTLIALGNGRFEQEVVILGNEGRLRTVNAQLFGLKNGTDCEQLLFSENEFPNIEQERRRSRTERVSGTEPASLSVSLPTCPAINTPTCAPSSPPSPPLLHIPKSSHLDLYEKAFDAVLQLLSSIPHRTDDEQALMKSAESWRIIVPHLASVASFEDVHYVTTVIQSIRRSSETGEWVNILGVD